MAKLRADHISVGTVIRHYKKRALWKVQFYDGPEGTNLKENTEKFDAEMLVQGINLYTQEIAAHFLTEVSEDRQVTPTGPPIYRHGTVEEVYHKENNQFRVQWSWNEGGMEHMTIVWASKAEVVAAADCRMQYLVDTAVGREFARKFDGRIYYGTVGTCHGNGIWRVNCSIMEGWYMDRAELIEAMLHPAINDQEYYESGDMYPNERAIQRMEDYDLIWRDAHEDYQEIGDPVDEYSDDSEDSSDSDA